MRKTSVSILALTAMLAFAVVAQADTYSASVHISGAEAGGGGTASSETGSAEIIVNTDANTLKYTIVFNPAGLNGSETAAHIHGFCLSSTGCGVVHGLPAGSPKVGTWNYSEGQEANILAGLTYINIHSSGHPGGEIGGQIDSLEVVKEVQALPATSNWALLLVSVLMLVTAAVFVVSRSRGEAL